MPMGGQAGRPQRRDAGAGLATVLITTAVMTASRWDLLVTLRLPDRGRLVTGQGATGPLAPYLVAGQQRPPGPLLEYRVVNFTGAYPGSVMAYLRGQQAVAHLARASTLGPMTAGPSLPLAEQAILAILSQRPAHGFAIARLTAPGGELGRIWHIPRPVVYRSIGRLLDAGLIAPAAVESGRGPQRTIYTVTAQGRQAATRWLDTPVEHVRDVRTQLLLKLALLDRAGRDPTDLLRRQRAVLEPIAAAIGSERPQRKGFDATLLAWRRATAAATLDFLDDIIQPGH
jgi:DNA-binding PadR family transcriptional regulator